MLNDKKIAFIGAGNMGEAIISGLIVSGSSKPENIICTDVRESRLDEIKSEYGVRVSVNNVEAVKLSDIIVYAVKPQIIAAVLGMGMWIVGRFV